ncbi:MAG: hypothetical protein M9947_02830 [Thermomicrobiales bacterium]|nr:hypothetical protein [Thermomicrobiales bacterium]
MVTASYAARQLAVQRQVNRYGLDLRVIRAGEPLELTYANGGAGVDDGTSNRPEIEWIEDAQRVVRPVDRTETVPIRDFLDGAQRTIPRFVGTTFPVVESICAAAVLEREPHGVGQVCAGTMDFQAIWILPHNCGDGEIRRFRAMLEEQGIEIRDPLGDAGPELLDDYSTMEQRIYAVAMEARAEHEERVYRKWCELYGDAGDWIVLDGRLRSGNSTAIGLVKSFSRHYLTGPSAAELYRMPEAHRTAAFRMFKRAGGDPITAWYLRLRDASGLDPRHGLVRIEVSGEIDSATEIDAISAALLAERSPRATGDDRWATLLYPIYHLEQALKRYLDANTRGWDAAS